MNWNPHLDLVGQHAFLSASQYHWLNYDKEKLITVWQNDMAKKKGTELHEFASTAIKLGQKLADTSQTLNMFVNDAIGFRMESEQVLYYSRNCFGTADAISYENNFLRIHDLKTGYIPASMNQLKIYAALFCLEYKIKPKDIGMEFRIYQSDDVSIYEPTPEEINEIMLKIRNFDKIIEKVRLEE